MELKRLWQKLFSQKTQEEEIALHVSGATVRHKSPFEDLKIHRNEEELTKDFADVWITPYYMTLMYNPGKAAIDRFAEVANNFTIDNTKKLLGYFDWRPKITAAFFAAINNHIELEDSIGCLLLKSEVSSAGSGYCFALAIFGTEKSKDYLKKYLNYYLLQKDLWFDQADAFCALAYIDKDESKFYIEDWNKFIANKPNWDLESSRKIFLASIESILNIRNLVKHRQ